jgi:hypothetical protein
MGTENAGVMLVESYFADYLVMDPANLLKWSMNNRWWHSSIPNEVRQLLTSF